MGIPDEFVEHGSRKELLAEMGLDTEGIHAAALGLAQAAHPEASEEVSTRESA